VRGFHARRCGKSYSRVEVVCEQLVGCLHPDLGSVLDAGAVVDAAPDQGCRLLLEVVGAGELIAETGELVIV
jgi:hypothetical protein